MALRHPFAVQLYSARKFPPLESQIAVVARCGFTHVETFGPLKRRTRPVAPLIATD